MDSKKLEETRLNKVIKSIRNKNIQENLFRGFGSGSTIMPSQIKSQENKLETKSQKVTPVKTNNTTTNNTTTNKVTPVKTNNNTTNKVTPVKTKINNNLTDTDRADIKKEADLENVLKNSGKYKEVDAPGEGNKGKKVLQKVEQPKQELDKKPEPKKMSSLERKNRARFGDAHIDKLKAKNVDFQSMKKGGMTKDAFIKKYPNSITAQRAAGIRDHKEWDAYDRVLEYLFSTEQVESLEEAHDIMINMDTDIINDIIS